MIQETAITTGGGTWELTGLECNGKKVDFSADRQGDGRADPQRAEADLRLRQHVHEGARGDARRPRLPRLHLDHREPGPQRHPGEPPRPRRRQPLQGGRGDRRQGRGRQPARLPADHRLALLARRRLQEPRRQRPVGIALDRQEPDPHQHHDQGLDGAARRSGGRDRPPARGRRHDRPDRAGGGARGQARPLGPGRHADRSDSRRRLPGRLRVRRPALRDRQPQRRQRRVDRLPRRRPARLLLRLLRLAAADQRHDHDPQGGRERARGDRELPLHRQPLLLARRRLPARRQGRGAGRGGVHPRRDDAGQRPLGGSRGAAPGMGAGRPQLQLAGRLDHRRRRGHGPRRDLTRGRRPRHLHLRQQPHPRARRPDPAQGQRGRARHIRLQGRPGGQPQDRAPHRDDHRGGRRRARRARPARAPPRHLQDLRAAARVRGGTLEAEERRVRRRGLRRQGRGDGRDPRRTRARSAPTTTTSSRRAS